MKLWGNSPLAVVLHICNFTLILASPPVITLGSLDKLDSGGTRSFPNSTTTFGSRLPPDPYQIHVAGTTTSIIFSNYGQKLLPKTVLDLCFEAQNQIVDAIVANHGDGPMPWRLRPSWTSSNTQIRISASKVMSWSMLAHAFKGIVQFMEEYGYIALQFEVLDDYSGIVGNGDFICTSRTG